MSHPLNDVNDSIDILKRTFGATLPGMFPNDFVRVPDERPAAKRAGRYNARAANFTVGDESGNGLYNDIMTKCVNGAYVFGSSQASFDKDGVAHILLTWYEPVGS